MRYFLEFIFGIKLHIFQTVPLSIIRSIVLYTQQWCMSYRFADSLRAGSQAVSKPVWHIPLLCVQCYTPDDGQRNCPKHVEFYSKNKFEKLVHLVGFYNKNLSRCTVTWTSNYSKIYICVLVYLCFLYASYPLSGLVTRITQNLFFKSCSNTCICQPFRK